MTMDWIAELVRHDGRWLAGVARREGLGGEDALDAVQDALTTFVSMAGAPTIAASRDEARSYLAALVTNVARNARRRHHRSQPHVDSDDAGLAAEGRDVDELLARAEDHARAIACVATLRDLQKKVVELRILGELSGADTARALDVAPGHVAVLLHRAKIALQRCMEVSAL